MLYSKNLSLIIIPIVVVLIIVVFFFFADLLTLVYREINHIARLEMKNSH